MLIFLLLILKPMTLPELEVLQNKYGFKYFSYDKNVNINLGNPYPICSMGCGKEYQEIKGGEETTRRSKE